MGGVLVDKALRRLAPAEGHDRPPFAGLAEPPTEAAHVPPAQLALEGGAGRRPRITRIDSVP